MQNRLERRLKIAIVFLVFVSHLALAITTRFPLTILLIPIVTILIMPFAERADRNFRYYRLSAELCTLAFVMALFFWITLTGIRGVLASLAALIIYIQVYSLLHRKTGRHYGYIVLMSFFLLLMAVVSDPPTSISFVLLLFLGASAWVLVLLEMYSANKTGEETPFMQIVRMGQRDVPLRAQRKRLFDPLFNSWVFAFFLCTLVVGMGFFLAAPRTDIQLIGGSQAIDKFTTGLSNEVDLTKGGFIELGTAAMMRIEFPEEEDGRYDGEFLWRSTSFDYYTGTGWTRKGVRSFGAQIVGNTMARKFSIRSGPQGSPEGIDRIIGEGSRLVKQQIFLNRTPDVGLPALPLAKTIVPDDMNEGHRLSWDSAGDFTVRVSDTDSNSMRYTVISDVTQPTPDQLRASNESFSSRLLRSDYRLLTNHNLREVTQRIARDVTDDASTGYDKIKALEKWLSEGEFTYSRNVPQLPDDHPIDAFIRNTKMGHCELYASALALMVRSLGIPARLVNGYRGATWNPDDHSYMVTSGMAHVWVEVFFIDYGWVSFDPSPPQQQVGRTAMGRVMSMISQITLRAKLFWLRNVIGFSPKDRFELFENISNGGLKSEGAGKTEATPAEGGEVVDIRVPQFIIILGAMIGTAVLLHFLFGLRQRSKSVRGLTEDQRRATRMYRVLLRRLRKEGLKSKGKSAEELLEDIETQGWENAGEIAPVILKYNAVRFGRTPFPKTQYDGYAKTVRSLQFLSD